MLIFENKLLHSQNGGQWAPFSKVCLPWLKPVVTPLPGETVFSPREKSYGAVVPNRWVAPQSGSRRGVVNNSFNSLLKAQIFRTAHINILCFISKTETRTDFCEVHIISIIISIWFLLYQGWPTSQGPRDTSLTVLPQRATSYTWAYMNITPALPHAHTYLCSARFIVSISHRHSHQACFHAVCKSHPGFHGEQLVQNFATYTRLNTIFAYEPHEAGQRAAS